MPSVLVSTAIALLAVACSSAALLSLHDAYDASTATEKADTIWHLIEQDTTPGTFMNPIKTLAKIADVSYLWLMGTTTGDWRSRDHRKITHGEGMHTRAHFEWLPNEYTGMFQKADHCVVRMANAAAPGGVTMGSYGPNLAVKCTRDGPTDSANLQMLYELDGYTVNPGNASKSCSYFEGSLSNHCARRDDVALPLKIFISQFAKVDDRPLMLGVSQMATASQDGTRVAKPNFPYALIFQPNPELNKIDCEFGEVRSQLKAVPAKSTLFKVYAARDPAAGYDVLPDPVLIGKLVMDSAFTSSKFGDTQLFFRHTFFNSEIKELESVSPARAAMWLKFTDPTDKHGGLLHQKIAGHAVYDYFMPDY